MKLAFSTLGCPGWSWEEIYATAKDLGLSGIEIRGIGADIYAPHAKPFKEEHIQKTLDTLKKLGLEISMLTSSAFMFDIENQEAVIKEAREYIELASKLGCRYIRVLGDRDAAPEGSIDIEHVKKTYKMICDIGEAHHVMPLIETNGVFADSSLMASFMKALNHPNSGVLWDIHHPYRFFLESPATTYGRLKEHIRYLHIKDSVIAEGKTTYRMLGYGDVPVLDCLKLLKEGSFEGYVSLEWVKRWCPDLQEPGVVFSHYISYMSYLIRQI